MNHEAFERIIVALDVPTESEALELARLLKPFSGYFKVGLELLNSVGIGMVNKIVNLGGKVFLDGKFMDIPNTVEGACRAATRSGARIINVHTMGGFEMMKAAANATEVEANNLGLQKPLVLGVTILTSINKEIMNQDLKVTGTVEDQVVHLARLAEKAGLDGVIASPQEIEVIRKNVSDRFFIVTPGVRPLWSSTNDQKRVMTPGEAIAKGASLIVIGRPITKPPKEIGSPVDAARRIIEEIEVTLKQGQTIETR
jgi:orotidine-5'-phosphate decarboxylase